MKTWKKITEKEFYKNYGNYEIKFYSYYNGEFIFGTDEEDNSNIDLTVNIVDNNDFIKLKIYYNRKYIVSDLKDFIWGAYIVSKQKGYMIEHMIQIYDKE